MEYAFPKSSTEGQSRTGKMPPQMRREIWHISCKAFISFSDQWVPKSRLLRRKVNKLFLFGLKKRKSLLKRLVNAEGEEGMPDQSSFVCYNMTVTNPNQVWKTDDIYRWDLPILAFQTCWTIFMTRLFIFIVRPFHIPRLVAEVLAGFVLSSEILGRMPVLYFLLFPVRGILNVEVLSNIGIIYYAFLIGLEMNLDNVLRAQKKAISIAVTGVIVPMAMGALIYSLHRKTYMLQSNDIVEDDVIKACLLWSLSLTVTGFPVLAEILASLKLLYTELGRSALNAAIVSDSFSWLLFILLMPFNLNDAGAIYTVVSTILFISICIFVVRPIVKPIIDVKTDKEEWNDHRLLFVLMGTIVCAYITDILGSHSVVGAFVFGLILPHGRFTDVMMAAADDFASGVLAPLVFAGTGMRMDITEALSHRNCAFSVLIMILLCIPKILSTLMATFIYGIPVRDGLGLGVLMNTKGVMSLIMLNIAWDRQILTVSSFSIIVAAVLIMTISSSVITNIVYNPRKQFKMNKLRTIQNSRLDAELRILACVHNTRHASSMVKILEAFNASRVSPLYVAALYLVELTSRGAFELLEQMNQPAHLGTQHLTHSQAELEHITTTFEGLSISHGAVRVETFNVVSSYGTIHEDIFNSANEKRTSLILLPFHKQQNSEGCLETLNSAYKNINYNVMQKSPCSVGIFVDRGICSLCKMNYRILMLFIGGPDDREALAVAWRMAAHPGVQVSLVRMLLFDDAAYQVDQSIEMQTKGILSPVLDSSRQNELDDEYVNSFRLRAVNNEDSITYSEREVHVAEDVPALLNELDQGDYNLYIVGQGRGRNSVIFSRFLDWCDCPELGAIGDILASNSFGSRSSVLVVQQYGYGSDPLVSLV